MSKTNKDKINLLLKKKVLINQPELFNGLTKPVDPEFEEIKKYVKKKSTLDSKKKYNEKIHKTRTKDFTRYMGRRYESMHGSRLNLKKTYSYSTVDPVIINDYFLEIDQPGITPEEKEEISKKYLEMIMALKGVKLGQDEHFDIEEEEE